MPDHPTPHADVNLVVHEFLSDVQSILGPRFVAMYLYGSLALGDFSPPNSPVLSSDIDFVVVTDAELPQALFVALHEMHARFDAGGSPWATQVEIVYIARNALRRYDPDGALCPHIQRGETLVMDRLDSGWIPQLHILREHGIVLAGPDPRTLIDPFSPEDLRRAMARSINEWPARLSHEPLPLHQWGFRVFTVLTMCRMLYTLDSGAVVSKPVAARWAQQTLGERWSTLIEWALAPRQHGIDMAGGGIEETLALVEYALERGRSRREPAGDRE
ncbi:MAG TPA: aminoglycoside adenylyltransferase domain-containing protein [Chloroflexota bacterium]|nr:aminoglycoside adenylyltransferase domain-containing protein [Chloroflexota bacterium]